MDQVGEIRQQCWKEAIYTFGTAYIFEQRANSYRVKIRALTFLGIFVPASVGSIFLSFGVNNDILSSLSLTIAGILGTVQLVLSIWSLSAKWDDSFSYALEALTANYRLADSYEKLARNPPADFDKLQSRFEWLETENRYRSDMDIKQGIKDEEKRKGMRRALQQYQIPCAGCERVPSSMTPSHCDICGNF